jgi:cysteine-rich repeat protein
MRPAAIVALLCLASTAHATAPSLPGLVTTTFTSTEGAVPIPDNAALVSVLSVPDAIGAVVDVDVAVDIAHTASGQLRISLLSPAGTTVSLTTNNGAANDDVFATTVFDDQAPGTPSARNVRNVTYTNLVSVGTVQPEQALGAFVGELAQGPWALVVQDDTGGNTGTLRSWSLTISTLPAGALTAGTQVTFDGAGMSIPDNRVAGVTSTVAVAGVGQRLLDVDVRVDVTHPNSSDLDLFLTAPSGHRIDLVTAIGTGKRDLYAGTTFDDKAGVLLSDVTLPASGTPIPRVVGEGALAAFIGEDPNGTWTLTVADHAAGNTGSLRGWTLGVTTTAVCGDGTVDPGEACDDGNLTNGDGCDVNCQPTGCGNGIVTAGEDCDDGNTADGDGCPASCAFSETLCDDCVDNDRNGLVDTADPACGAAALGVRHVRVTHHGRGHDQLVLTGALSFAGTPSGDVQIVLGNAAGTVACGSLGPLHGRSRRTASGRAASGAVTVALSGRKGSRLTLKGRDLNFGGDRQLSIGLRVGGESFAGTATLR